MRDDQVRDKWREAGGQFYGPNVEHGHMEEGALLKYLRSLYDRIDALEAAVKPFAWYADVNDVKARDPRKALEVPTDDLIAAKKVMQPARRASN